MTTTRLNLRRWLAFTAAALVLAAGLGYLLRLPLTAAAVASALRLAGAGAVKLSVSHSSPWRVVIDDLDFRVMTQSFAAKRVTMERRHWWTPSLGAVHVEQARVPVTVDGSDTNPWAWATYTGKPGAASAPAALPLEEISIEGQLIVQAAALPEQTVVVKLTARLVGANEWKGTVQAEGRGLAIKAEGAYHPSERELLFRVPEVSVDLATWQDFLQRLVLLPGGRWELGGKLSGSAEGRARGKDISLAGRVQLREGRVGYSEKSVSVTGVEADLAFDDMWKIHTAPGQTVRAEELRVGELTARAIRIEFALESAEKIAVSRATLQALGGSVSAEPFKLFATQRELEAVLLVDGVDVAQVLALAKDVPAQATGRVNGRVPIRIDAGGLRFGTGWLALKPGVSAEVQFKADGLLTGGVDPKNPRYAVLKMIESGLLRLKVGEMRLELRPPNMPPGRTATLHVTGEPVDPNVKAPVTLDLNVNGPLERLLSLGMDSRVKLGPAKK